MTRLADHFAGISAKALSAVETDTSRSNQHELNGTAAMKRYLGEAKTVFNCRFLYIGEEDERSTVGGLVTWYDARENHPTRSEYRLYFSDNQVMSDAAADDILVTALDKKGELLLLVISADNQSLQSILWLFGLNEIPDKTFVTVDVSNIAEQSTAIFGYIAEEAGLEIEQAAGDDWLELMLARFGERFPSTRELSSLAKETLGSSVNAFEEPDLTLVHLMDREEVMFRQLERKVVSGHLALHAGSWAEDVDSFVKFSLSVQNRRKSRAGHALENHLEWVLAQHPVQFERGARTEGHSKPDFLFPGSASYHDTGFPSRRLTMLGVKTSCKDRWRQVLNEASRIEQKHLFTLQPSISEHQTDEMMEARLGLVLPASLHGSYSPNQRKSLLSLGEFIQFVEDLQP